MKVKFNLPSKRYTNNFSFDNNTTLGIGNVQPLFCKFLVAGSKVSIGYSQLTRLSPLVVPTFARLKQSNNFCFVPMSMVMPSYDAFLSNTTISVSNKTYTPKSLPCITNEALFCSLLLHYCDVGVYNMGTKKWEIASKTVTPFTINPSNYGSPRSLSPTFPLSDYDDNSLPRSGFDFFLDNTHTFINIPSGKLLYVRLRQSGRYWYTVLRGLGYSCDPGDNTPVSILPLWAFARAYYDLYYPKRYSPWHASNYYYSINRHYNGYFNSINYKSSTYDMVETWDCLTSLFGGDYSFDFFASVDDNLVTAATTTPNNLPSAAPNSNIGVLSSQYDGVAGAALIRASSPYSENGVPSVVTPPSSSSIGADQLALVNKLWDFVSKSSAVGQSVKDWLRVHFGVTPNDDMFDQTHLIESVVNDVSINTVVSTAQTSDGKKGDNLGALAGQGYATKHGRVQYEVKTFGFCMCLSSLVPISGVSSGTQPELYLNTYYEQPFAEFDGLGYEILNKSSFIETQSDFSNKVTVSSLKGGFGFVPRLSSHKTLHNIRSGNFVFNSVKDSFIPYCIDVIPLNSLTSGILWSMPWSLQSNFLSFNRIFYNTSITYDNVGQAPLDDNFMSQTSFDFSYTSYLKPLSDTYSVEQLGKDIISVKKQ